MKHELHESLPLQNGTVSLEVVPVTEEPVWDCDDNETEPERPADNNEVVLGPEPELLADPAYTFEGIFTITDMLPIYGNKYISVMSKM